jgi:hypothetical protein
VTGKDFMRITAPLLAAGGVWLAQRALSDGYKAATGAPPPKADDLEAPMSRVLLFAAGAAMMAAVVNVVITRQVARAAAPRPDQVAGV